MPSAFGDLNGSGNQQIWINVYRVSQDWGGNYTTFFGEVRYYGNGYGSWVNDPQYWAANFGGYQVSGSWTIPYERRNDQYTTLWSGYFTRGHDGNGFASAFYCSASIDSNHSSIGDGSVGTTEEAAPRIPKRPSEPGVPTFSEITPTSVRVSWGGSGDDRGSGIDGYLLRSWPGTPSNPGQTGGYTDHSIQNNTSRVVSGLSPGETRTWAIYAHNGAADNSGFSNVGPSAVFTTPAGIYVSDGSSWRATSAQVSTGSAWEVPFPQISDGAAWEDPINV